VENKASMGQVSRLKIAGALLIMLLVCSCGMFKGKKENPLSEQEKIIEKQLLYSNEAISDLLEKNSDSNLVGPRSVNKDNTIRLVPSKDWCSGFYPGVFWQMAKLTDDDKWKVLASKYTAPIEQEKINGKTHDMGFKMFCSFGNGYLQTCEPEYREILIKSANTLITRFNENVGCIRSWDHNTDKWDFPVIIDNMMNLELLFWASVETGDPVYANIAIKHAETTLSNHFREDNSSYHVIDYNPETGEIQNKHTHQGYSHESAWARGQAWGLYGFTMCYRKTEDPKFLNRAIDIAEYIINNRHLPKDKIPYWDFDARDNPNEPRDASAAAITASALYELSTYSKEKSQLYIKNADKIIQSLCSDDYLAKPGTNQGFILKHSTGSKPHNGEVDVPIIYADYYFLEALNRKKRIKNHIPLVITITNMSN
jgi:hypothetical protein